MKEQDVMVTIVKKIGCESITIQFGDYGDFIDYLERNGDIEEALQKPE